MDTNVSCDRADVAIVCALPSNCDFDRLLFDHRNQIPRASQLGSAMYWLWANGRYKELVSLRPHAVSLLSTAVGELRSMAVYYQLLLAEAYNRLGQYEEVIEQATSVLHDPRVLVGEAYEPTIAARCVLAHACEKMNRLSEAEVETSRALSLSQKVLGVAHPTTRHILCKLGILFRQQKRYLEAGRALSEALKGHRMGLGETYSDSFMYLKPLSSGFAEAGYPSIVESIFRLTTHSRQVFMDRPDSLPGLRFISQKPSAFALDVSVERPSLTVCMAYSLLKDSTICSLYLRVLGKFGLEQFLDLHDRILSEYLLDLQNSTITGLKSKAIASINEPKNRRDTTRTVLLLMTLREQSILTSLGI
ncbi:hypothetical protein B0I35DRAFT_447608, partial [Stachybotrys elegans]